jgi:hypothetical protein
MKSTIKFTLIVLVLVSIIGCNDVDKGQNSSDTTVTSKTAKTPEEIAAQQALLAPMDAVAKKNLSANTAWESLGSEDKQPFLDFHSGNEEKAKTHYAGMLEQHREMQAN